MNRRRLLLAAAPAAALGAASVSGAAHAGPAPLSNPEFQADFSTEPRRTAFINVDLQNCFVDENSPVAPADAHDLLMRLNAFAAACRTEGVLVIHTAHVVRPGLTNAGTMPAYIPVVRDGMITKGAHSAALHKDVVVDPRDIVLEKPRFGAFQGTDLEAILRTRGVDAVIVGGIATNICCESTAREAQARDFKLFFLSDGTSTAGTAHLAAAQHQAATLASISLFGQVLTMDAMLAKLRGPPKIGAG